MTTSQQSSRRIVVFGSMNADISFQVAALPKPGETVIGPGYSLVPGGKGANQAVAAARAGAEVIMFGAVGRDAFGDLLLAALQNDGVDRNGIMRLDAPTGCAAIMVDGKGRNQIVVGGGANLQATAESVPDEVLGPNAFLLLQQEVPPAENRMLIMRAAAAGTPVLLNAAPALPVGADLLERIDTLIVNEIEVAAIAASLDLASGDPIAAAHALADRFNILVIATLGAAGVVAIEAGQQITIPALPIRPIDTTAAGDAFVGAYAAARARGLPLEPALRVGAVAGSLACLRPGAQSSLPTQAEIEAQIG